jgi:parallel beta-helix repeat protein
MSPNTRTPGACVGLACALASVTGAADALAGAAAAAPRQRITYVSANGSDSARGTRARPWRTLQRAASAATPGTTVLIGSGVYAGFSVLRSGEPGLRIVFRPAPRARVSVVRSATASSVIVVQARHIVLRGLAISGSATPGSAAVDILDGSDDVAVLGSRISGNAGFGIDASGSTNVLIQGNDVSDSGTGIQINRAGAGTRIRGNVVHDNRRMLRNDPAPSTDFGAVGIGFLHTTGPIVASGNRIYGNRAPSDDYGYDGSGFEIYGASGVAMVGNVIYDDQTIFESGKESTDAGCFGNSFTRNVAYGGNDKSTSVPLGPQVLGLQLRCAQDMLVANNTFYDLDSFVYRIAYDSRFAGSIAGLRILNNINEQPGSKVYSLGAGIVTGIQIDFNLDDTGRSKPIASIDGQGDVRSVADLRARTTFADHDVGTGARMRNPLERSFVLTRSSPAVDRGTIIAGVTAGFHGHAPDIGAKERR